MYKVFVNDKPIILTSSDKNEDNLPVYLYKNIVIEEILYRLKTFKSKGVYLFCANLEKDWKDFKNNFKLIKAAGGLVLNEQNEALFIYRANRWDLPKGRIEKGEEIETTAIREVEEECGVYNLSITTFLTKTYHIFYHKNQIRLKQTFWYLMNTNYKGELKPQEEEGITKVVFMDNPSTKKALGKTYANIVLVYEAYQKLS